MLGRLDLVERLDVEHEIGLDSADSHLLPAFEEEPLGRLGSPELAPHEDLAAAAANSPISPTIVCGPTETGLRRTCTAFEIANAQAPPSTRAIDTISQTLAW